MKKVYILKGSWEGNLGVYSNKKKLHEAIKTHEDFKISYSKLCIELKKCWTVMIEETNPDNEYKASELQIETFTVNA